jgi:hypothetical protein
VSFTRRSMYPRDFPLVPTEPDVIGTRAAVYAEGKDTVLILPGKSPRSPSSNPRPNRCRLPLKCDGTPVVTRFRLSAKRTSPFTSARASVQSTTGSRSVRVSGSNAGYTKFRGSVKSTGYPLHSPVSPSLPLPCVTVCHRVSTGLYRLSQPEGSPNINLYVIWTSKCYAVFQAASAIACALQLIGAFHEIRKLDHSKAYLCMWMFRMGVS